MLPGSHVAPIKNVGPDSLRSPRLLADAFSEFISASSLLEASYRDLQREVAHLGFELAERNAALTRSLAENDRMRAALQQMIDSMPCGVLVLDTAEIIVMINPEGRRLLELGDAEVKSLRDLSAISKINFESLLARSDDHLDNELCLSSSTGKRWLAIGNQKLSCAPASQEVGSGRTPLQSIWILRDITANKLAEQEREAARSAMALAEISTILAHEIRNPLASMELFAGLIAEDPGQTSQWVSHLRAGIRMLSGTVSNVLSIHCGTNPQLTPLNLISCMQTGVEFVRPIAEQAGVSLSFISEDDRLTIEGNEEGLRQIILNLICNAIRHTPCGGKIIVSIRPLGTSRALVEVTDTGCGIPASLMQHLFDAGFSASGDTPGLGLAVCKRLMMQHGGEIRVSSRVNCGSTFQLEFPTL
ncbi:two-component system sensor histidine kinase FlrB [Silvibacterium bohemicum]|uniref:histidine kinase n=1 Tax=Silvibacterium bohemicum TaxID=1577686 RepID=A0A841K411_9BACT|nr:ATP-binding protein [Silvibacterium bohemicum]MBB6144994.1 two-component system sensor histidine kinase FlrB [Silvibacterium bohemicum]